MLICRTQVEELWESMCTAVVNLTAKGLSDVEDAEALIKIKTIIALFIQTMEVCYAPSLRSGMRWAFSLYVIGLGVLGDSVGQLPSQTI